MDCTLVFSLHNKTAHPVQIGSFRSFLAKVHKHESSLIVCFTVLMRKLFCFQSQILKIIEKLEKLVNEATATAITNNTSF